jgi:hypothetical protein
VSEQLTWPDNNSQILEWERSIWHTALACDGRLGRVARRLAIDMLEMVDPRPYYHRGAIRVHGDLGEIADVVDLPQEVCAAAVDELIKAQILIRRLRGWEFDLAYLDRQQTSLSKQRKRP